MISKALLLLAAVYCHCACASYSHYHGPLAKPVVLKSGYLADTHEVAAAKSAHIAALSKQSHGYGYGGDYGYGDSHGYGGNYGYSHGYDHGHSHDDHDHLRYHGPTAVPHVLHDGHIADTHEVAAAKAEHYAAVAKAQAHGGYGQDYSGQYASGYGGYHGYPQHGQYASGYGSYNGYSHHAAPYHGPLAKPVVLHNGYLADTHEVAAAKHHHLQALHSGHATHYHHY